MVIFRSSHAVYDCRYHLVWSTKYRKKIFEHEHEREECKKLLKRAAEEYGMKILTIEVDEDHLHLYIEVPPQMSIGNGVGILKSISARKVFQRFPYFKKKPWAGHLWESSYFVRSVGEGVTAEMVKLYIENHGDQVLWPAQGKLFPKGTMKPKR
ncbi:MAG: IS200/IS605 family transposase [Deltaproteobacteria bacterium]|nr:IS200/IS605 family transposase [Deltaproteobacteria bacterium]